MDFLIIGGGIHGVHIATRLVGEADVAPEKIRIVDPGDELLGRWRTCTATTGMSYLRSPSVHHLDLDPFSLLRFAGKKKRRDPGLFVPPFDRPDLGLFNAHCDRVMETYGLSDLHIRDRAVECSLHHDAARVRLASGCEMATQNIVLALGAGERPSWPEWAPRGDDRIRHIFEPGFDGWPSSGEPVAVIGGGISAVQVALRLVESDRPVHLVSRHALRQHQFDSEPGWLGPKLMKDFNRERNMDRRRARITDARHRGSVPREVHRALRIAVTRGQVCWHEKEVAGIEAGRDGLRVRLSSDMVLDVGRVLLATGFASKRPGGAMVDSLIDSASLPCASCGYPIVDSGLRWHPRIYVSGPLAELEVGPAARNIAGARRAGDKVVAAVRASSS